MFLIHLQINVWNEIWLCCHSFICRKKNVWEKYALPYLYTVDSADIRVQFYILMNGCVTVSSMLMELIILYYYLIF